MCSFELLGGRGGGGYFFLGFFGIRGSPFFPILGYDNDEEKEAEPRELRELADTED